jgi:salicylate hydroxylase
LTQIFAAFAEKRQPRTAALVKGARAQGERRVVVGGPAACKERDELIRQQWIDEAALEARFDALLKEPFP